MPPGWTQPLFTLPQINNRYRTIDNGYSNYCLFLCKAIRFGNLMAPTILPGFCWPILGQCDVVTFFLQKILARFNLPSFAGLKVPSFTTNTFEWPLFKVQMSIPGIIFGTHMEPTSNANGDNSPNLNEFKLIIQYRKSFILLQPCQKDWIRMI